MSEGPASHSGRHALPQRLGDILSPALERLATSEQAAAYRAWGRGAGEQVAAGARPRYFARGVLTVECESSVWANELTYLGSTILARMDQVAPGHPVKRFRFVIARGARGEGDGADGRETPTLRERRPDADYEPARRQALEVRDERLRVAIDAVLRRLDQQAPPPGDDDDKKPRKTAN